MSITSQNIAGQIAALDTAVADWERIADEQALSALAGDEAACRKLVEANQNVEHAKADRRVLERARGQAEKAEAAAKAQAEAEVRGRHIEDARLNARQLLDIAARVDALVAEVSAAMSSLQASEDAVRRALIAARA
ncbi:hypothetical protein AB4144_17890, partial [Rhizobiaceae sp. 2RAB30]